ncbi:alpha/beta fold hydrolase [Actinosynnema sp. NPDC050436]|uniref:alpha/beta fold hydrolase n=1 Tax=Actinosynnema sp. NPDC050436 TaxID=3155659 RepID=UPI0033DF3F2A
MLKIKSSARGPCDSNATEIAENQVSRDAWWPSRRKVGSAVRGRPEKSPGSTGFSPERPLTEYPFESRWFDNDGFRQHYLDQGRGEPVLMVHGNPSWSYFWRHLVAALQDGHRCVVPDHIGMGLSDRPAEAAYPYSAARRVEDLDRLVDFLVGRKGLPDRGWTLMAHDWGGPIGLAWAQRHPGVVARLVMLNTGVLPWPPAYRLPWFLRFIRDWRSAAWFVDRTNLFTLAAARFGAIRPLPPAVRRAYIAPYARRRHRLAVTRFVQDIPLAATDASWDVLHDGARTATGLPLFIGWGERDPVFNGLVLDQWLHRFPDAVVQRYPNAGHYVLEDAADDLIPRIRSFLDAEHHASLPRQEEI